MGKRGGGRVVGMLGGGGNGERERDRRGLRMRWRGGKRGRGGVLGDGLVGRSRGECGIEGDQV